LLSARACQEGVITIFNDQQWRPFVHVKDLAEAMILLLEAPLQTVAGQVFNVGDNRLNHTLSELAQVIQRICPQTRVDSVENSDKRNYRVKFDKIQNLLGFSCRYSLQDGVREIKAALESSQISSYRNIRFNNLSFLREAGTPDNKNDIDREIMAAFAGERIPWMGQGEIAIPETKAKAATAN